MVTDPHTHKHAHKQTQTGPITIHCAAKLSAQCNKQKDTNVNTARIPVLVYESIESQAISPACSEIANVDVWVAGRFHLTPQQQCILRRLYFTGVQLLHRDVLYLLHA